ncbi:MAG: aspartate kinase [Clostridiaceae bacterium]
MSEIVVAKFGGSSLSDSTQFMKVKDIIMSDPRRRYVIPSAPGKRFNKDYKVTDLLYLCHSHVEQGISFEDVFKILSDRYNEIINDLKLDFDISKDLKEIKDNISNGASKDYTASRGEYLNGLILSKYLGFNFVDATDLIVFNKRGRLDSIKTYELIKEKLSNLDNAVIPGFYGLSYKGEIKTFSRGGSDITGALISSGINATLYENWTDVSGFLMADPRIIEKPKHIKEITYRELRELSYMGATVLHEDSVFPVREAEIPINIKNTNKPDHCGTLIVNNPNEEINSIAITGIAGKKDFTVIAIEKTMMNQELGFCRKLLSIIESNGVSFENMPAGIDTVSLVIANSELKDKLDNILDEIEDQLKPDSLLVYPDMALIATVGKRMNRQKGVSAKIFKALEKENVNVRMINQGSSEINIIVGVENSDFEKTIKAIYNCFISKTN